MAYEKAVANATASNGALHVPAGDYGPIGRMIGGLTAMAQSGALDGTLLSQGQFYNTNYTKPLLFIAERQLPGQPRWASNTCRERSGE